MLLQVDDDSGARAARHPSMYHRHHRPPGWDHDGNRHPAKRSQVVDRNRRRRQQLVGLEGPSSTTEDVAAVAQMAPVAAAADREFGTVDSEKTSEADMGVAETEHPYFAAW